MTRRARLVAVVILVVLFSGGFKANARELPMQSVRALQAVIVNPLTGQVALRNICTATSVDDKVWLTAGHCVSHGLQTYISGEPVSVVKIDEKADLALVKSRFVSAPPVAIAAKGPAVLAEMVMVGHPRGFFTPVVTKGWVSAPRWHEPGMSTPRMLVQIVGGPGNSGSAILNTRGEIVSVLLGGWGLEFGEMVVGTAHQTLVTFIKG